MFKTIQTKWIDFKNDRKAQYFAENFLYFMKINNFLLH